MYPDFIWLWFWQSNLEQSKRTDLSECERKGVAPFICIALSQILLSDNI